MSFSSLAKWLKQNASYLRVVLFGLLSVGGISGIYSFLGNVNSLAVMPDQTLPFNGPIIIDGIMCQSLNSAISGNNNACNTMAKDMAAERDTNTNWNCNSYTDYSSTTLYAQINIFRYTFIALILCAAIATAFAIIHDFSLIYNRNNLSKLQSYPLEADQDFHLSFHYFYELFLQQLLLPFIRQHIFDDENGDSGYYCFPNETELDMKSDSISKRNYCISCLMCFVCCPLICILLFLFAICLMLDLCWHLVVYPCLYCCCGCCAKRIGLYSHSKSISISEKRPTKKSEIISELHALQSHMNNAFVQHICYISAAWVGIARNITFQIAMLLSLIGLSGIPRSISSMDGLGYDCTCNCSLILQPSNFYTFMTVTYILAIVNILFVIEWYKESVHGQQFLYLVTYTLPLFRVANINNDDVAGNMMGVGNDGNEMATDMKQKLLVPKTYGVTDVTNVDSSAVEVQSGRKSEETVDEMKMDEEIKVNDEIRNESVSGNVNTMTSLSKVFRGVLMVMMIFISLVYFVSGILIVGYYNQYNYDDWLAGMIQAFGWILFVLLFGGVIFACCKWLPSQHMLY